jgi:hypothetical protein
MVVINLVGPPASGKSSFAARFVLEHPDFTYLSIDQFRIDFQDETTAWVELDKAIAKNKKIVLETSGLSWKLKHITYHINYLKRPMFTILFTGDRDILQERLKNRQKRSIPMPYHRDEIEFLDWALENEHKIVTPEDLVINATQEGCTIEDIYSMCCSKVANFRVKNSI